MSANEEEVKKEADKQNSLLEAIASKKPPVVFTSYRTIRARFRPRNPVVPEKSPYVSRTVDLNLDNDKPDAFRSLKFCKIQDGIIKESVLEVSDINLNVMGSVRKNS